MEQLSFFAGQGEDRNESQDDDSHREEDRTSDQPRRFQHRPPDEGSIFRINLALLDEAKGIFGDDYSRVYEHTNRDRNSGQRHQVRADPGVVHESKSQQHGKRPQLLRF